MNLSPYPSSKYSGMTEIDCWNKLYGREYDVQHFIVPNYTIRSYINPYRRQEYEGDCIN